MKNRKIAFVFPGQGSQYVGMGKEICEQYPIAKKVYRQGDEKLDSLLSQLCFYGPEEELRLTVNTQPAILITSAAILKVLELEGIRPDYTAGHSLGEYTALVAAGSLTIPEAVGLVRQRGIFMQEAVPPGQGTMAAIIGLSIEDVQAVCAEIAREGAEVVEPANFNCPGQVAIAGHVGAVQRAMELAKERGAKRVVPLSVSGPFHSSLLQPASHRLAQVLEEVLISRPWVPVVANYTAGFTDDPQEIKENLVKQVCHAVLWQQSIEKLLTEGVNTFIEIGPGKVLSGLIKKIDKDVEIYNIEDRESLTKTVLSLKEAQRYVS
ncbi:MAG: ACP S-malonyltransferase [Peptococcia bacterium]|jgi:[acyl-carrier-protein] S-malonyltransferase